MISSTKAEIPLQSEPCNAKPGKLPSRRPNRSNIGKASINVNGF
jgi:hypothetical protein